MLPSEPTCPSWQWPFLTYLEPFPKGLRQVSSQIIGGGAGGEACNVTVPPSHEI